MLSILFVLPYYKIGGTLTSFANLIPLIDRDKYEISAYAVTNDIDDFDMLPGGVNYVGLEQPHSKEAVTPRGIKSRIISYLKTGRRLLAKMGFDISDVVFRKMAIPLSGKYDVVIAFQEGTATRMAQFISAPQKVAWVHSMYSRFKSCNRTFDVGIYNNFEKIVCVSHTAAKDMEGSEPQWHGKICVVYNAVDAAKLIDKASEGIAFNKKMNIVSVGRIDPVKRFSYIPAIASRLKEAGLDFDWWIIGGVADKDEYDNLMLNIHKLQVEDCVLTIGALSNPYPYIKSSDLLVCLSSSETFNYTIAEAKAIGTPVVTADFPSAFEFVEQGETGLILPMEKIADGIFRMLVDKSLYTNIVSNLASIREDVPTTKQQFESLLK